HHHRRGAGKLAHRVEQPRVAKNQVLANPADVVGPTDQGIAPGEFAELVRAIRNGAAYANVHSTNFRSGEIRGNIHRD
ncbi:MAG: CHRD domain-containing protein, partial [Candidatus Limnocylindrales bacterium]